MYRVGEVGRWSSRFIVWGEAGRWSSRFIVWDEDGRWSSRGPEGVGSRFRETAFP
jgi:hypothetical protein